MKIILEHIFWVKPEGKIAISLRQVCNAQEIVPELVITSGPIDLAALLFSKAGKVETLP